MLQDYDFTTGKIIDPGMRQAIILIGDKQEADHLATILRRVFFPVKGIASNVQAGLELLRKFKKGVLFLDAEIPGIGMLELLDKIRRRYPDIKIAMVTSAITKERAAELKDGGATAFLLTPFEDATVGKLLARIQ